MQSRESNSYKPSRELKTLKRKALGCEGRSGMVLNREVKMREETTGALPSMTGGNGGEVRRPRGLRGVERADEGARRRVRKRRGSGQVVGDYGLMDEI